MSGCAIAVAGWPEEPAQPETPNKIPSKTGLERNLVIQFVTLEAGRRFARATATTTLAAAIPAIQHGQFATEILQHHFRGVFLGAIFVGPFAGLQLAFDIDLGALAQIFFRHLSQILVED